MVVVYRLLIKAMNLQSLVQVLNFTHMNHPIDFQSLQDWGQSDVEFEKIL